MRRRVGGWILLEKLHNGVDHIDHLAASADMNCRAQPTVVIHTIEDLESAAIHRLVELDVDRSDVVWIVGS
jgi:hypothetical protein